MSRNKVAAHTDLSSMDSTLGRVKIIDISEKLQAKLSTLFVAIQFQICTLM